MVKRQLFIIALLIFCIETPAQTYINDRTIFDFWVGSWEVSWYDKDSNLVKGSNLIEKTLDGKVIQENFVIPKTGFKGISI